MRYRQIIHQHGIVRKTTSAFRRIFFEWTRRDLNPRPPPCQGGDLPLIYGPSSRHTRRHVLYLFSRVGCRVIFSVVYPVRDGFVFLGGVDDDRREDESDGVRVHLCHRVW